MAVANWKSEWRSCIAEGGDFMVALKGAVAAGGDLEDGGDEARVGAVLGGGAR